MKVYGHRGAPLAAPENTLASFKAAFEMGSHGAECDIHFTSDKQIVLIHTNCELGILWGREGAVVENMTLEELRALKCTGFDGRFADKKFRRLKKPIFS